MTDALRALVENWRFWQRSDESFAADSEIHKFRGESLKQCADELEAALTAVSRVPEFSPCVSCATDGSHPPYAAILCRECAREQVEELRRRIDELEAAAVSRVPATHRGVVFLAQWSWYGGASHGTCVFTSREEAIRYAKFSARGFINWETWTTPQGSYPYESARDDVRLDPTFRAEWTREKGGFVSVSKMGVCEKFDWTADNAEGVSR